MKKVLALVLAVCVVFTGVLSASAFELARHEETQIAYIEGTASGQYVTIIIKDGAGEVAHINQYEVADGKYSAKFPVEGDGSFTYSVNDGTNDVTNNVTLAKVDTTPVTVDVAVAEDTNGGKYIKDNSSVSAVANITNKYGDNENFKVMLAFYDENNKLLDVKISTEYNVAYEKLADKKTLEYGIIPANTVRIKAFAWENEATLIPAGQADTAEVNDMIFGNDEQKVVVAFLGDSISHAGYHQRFVESYYKSKYPGREILFLNKGIDGDEANRIVSRFGYEIMEDKYTPAPDEAVMMIGMNDINRGIYPSGTDAAKQGEIDECLASIEDVILLCKENNVTLTLITPSLYDDDEDFTGGTSSNNIGSNDALGKVGEGMKAFAAEYNLPIIDLHTATNYWTDTIRATEGWENQQVITGSDRIHPDLFGGFVMAYEIIKQQNIDGIVASVEIDAAESKATTENAKVTNLDASETGVSYTYKANSLPFAYSSEYKKAEGFNIPVTEDINNEIIKVTGLADGTYTIKMNGTALTKTYSAAELAEGVNIAIDSNNPGQKQAMQVESKVREKASREQNYRQIPSVESIIVRLSKVSTAGIKYVIDDVDDVAEYVADEENVTAFVNSQYCVNSGVTSFYTNKIKTYNQIKPIQGQEWAAIEALDAAANALAFTEEISVVIEKQ